MRKEVTDLLLHDFGYDLDKAVKKVETTFGGRPYEELSPDEKVRYEKLMEKNTAFAEWFIADERKVIVDCLRNITEEVYVANSIWSSFSRWNGLTALSILRSVRRPRRRSW